MKAVSGLQLVLVCRLLGKWVLAVVAVWGCRQRHACLLAWCARSMPSVQPLSTTHNQPWVAGVKIQVQVVAERGSGSSSSSADGSEGSTDATSGAASMPDPARVAALAASLAAALLLAT